MSANLSHSRPRPIGTLGLLSEGPRNAGPNSMLPMPSWVDYWAGGRVTVGPCEAVLLEGYPAEAWEFVADWVRWTRGLETEGWLSLPVPMRRLREVLECAAVIVGDIEAEEWERPEVWRESVRTLHSLVLPEKPFRPRGFPETVHLFMYPRLARVALVACGKSKVEGPVPAAQLYRGFGVRQGIAEGIFRCGRSHTYVLSAEHHLVPLERELVAYEKTLKGATRKTKEAWAANVFLQLWARYPVRELELHVFAGKDYTEHLFQLLPPGWRVVNVLEGLGQGKRNKELKRLRAERERILTPSKEKLS